MSKVITFSTVFPSYHPKKGQDTGFVEKILSGEKVHTIRAGHRWKVGDVFSPRVWSGEPYRSKQIQFAPDIEVKKVWDFELDEGGLVFIGRDLYAYPNSDFALEPLAKNDGLETVDLMNWFPNPFKGQIIAWNENINY